jgi:hypothetical protein
MSATDHFLTILDFRRKTVRSDSSVELKTCIDVCLLHVRLSMCVYGKWPYKVVIILASSEYSAM